MVSETFMAYWGCPFPDHMRRDLEDMKRGACNNVVLWTTEFDLRYLANAKIRPALDIAHELGMRLHADLWGFGNVTCHNARVSEFVQENPETWQVGSDGLAAPICCVNNTKFREWMKSQIANFLKKYPVDGLLWDEIHFDPRGWPHVWHCRCDTCKDLFKRKFDSTMPARLTEDVAGFRRASMVHFVQYLSRAAKDVDKNVEIGICVYPESESPNRFGTEDWEGICRIPELDTFGTDPYWIGLADKIGVEASPYQFRPAETLETRITSFSDRVVSLCRKHSKKSALWVQGCSIPAGREEEVYRAAILAGERGVDVVGSWSYRDYGFDNPSADPELVWRKLSAAFIELSGKYH